MTRFSNDLRHALRAVRRSPGFVAAATLTLALGIGATTTLVNVVDTLMFRPPTGVQGADRLVRPYFRFQASFGSWTGGTVSYPDFTDLRDKVPAFSAVAAYYQTNASLGRGVEARRVKVYGVTGDYFPLLGVRAQRGRLLEPAEDSVARPAYNAVLSDRFWRAGLGANPEILGQSVIIGNDRFTVVGVTQPGFAGGELTGPDLWVPMSAIAGTFAGPEFAAERNSYFIRTFGRLRDGVSPAVAAAQATAAIQVSRSDTSSSNGFKDVMVGPIQEARGPEAARDVSVALLLVGVSVIVLLVACANVGNLLLHRGLLRGRELAIRKALGASRGRIARLLLMESLVLGVMGGAAALLFAVWGGGAVRRFLLPAGSEAELVFDVRLFAFAAAASLVAGLIAGLMPAWRSARGDLSVALKDGSGGAGYRRSKLRDGLVMAQVALSVLLVVGAGLFVRSLRNVLALDLGFDVSHVMILSSELGASGYPEPEIKSAFQAMQDAVRRALEVESTSLSVGGPFGWSFGLAVKLPGRDSLPRVASGGPYFQAVDPAYRRTVGLALREGRDLIESDRRGAPKVALIGSEMARLFWPGQRALGQCMHLGDDSGCTEVVGVIADGRRNGIIEDPQLLLYLPLEQNQQQVRQLTLFVRTRGDARLAVGSVQALAQRAYPGLPYVRAQAMADIVAPQQDAWRMGATMFGLFGMLALTLATIGVYSALAYAVRGRTRELGIRLALGASHAEIMRLVARDGVRLVAIGLVIGLILAVAAGRAMVSLLYGVQPADPLVFGTTSVLLIAAAALACLLPARRAVRVDPMVALRAE